MLERDPKQEHGIMQKTVLIQGYSWDINHTKVRKFWVSIATLTLFPFVCVLTSFRTWLQNINVVIPNMWLPSCRNKCSSLTLYHDYNIGLIHPCFCLCSSFFKILVLLHWFQQSYNSIKLKCCSGEVGLKFASYCGVVRFTAHYVILHTNGIFRKLQGDKY